MDFRSLVCIECEDGGDFVIDRQNGDAICTNCGLVADYQIMDTEFDYGYNENTNNINTDGNVELPNSLTLNSLNEIKKICGQASLTPIIQDEACRIFIKVKTIKRKNNNSMYATVIFIACQKTGNPRSKNEIINSIPNVCMKDFSKFFKKCVLEIGGSSHTKPTDFMIRFCSKLGLNNSDIKLCKRIAEKCVSDELNNTPVALAAAIIYFASFLNYQL
jgi:transcription initiation factor TFIIIB Brf1 subunit/transcription initiation factor TFIIB